MKSYCVVKDGIVVACFDTKSKAKKYINKFFTPNTFANHKIDLEVQEV